MFYEREDIDCVVSFYSVLKVLSTVIYIHEYIIGHVYMEIYSPRRKWIYHKGQGIAYNVRGAAKGDIGNAEARVIYSSMNTATNEILMNI